LVITLLEIVEYNKHIIRRTRSFIYAVTFQTAGVPTSAKGPLSKFYPDLSFVSQRCTSHHLLHVCYFVLWVTKMHKFTIKRNLWV